MLIDPAEVIAKCEEMSMGCLALARNARDERDRKYCESLAGAYDHCIAMLRGTDRSGPEYEAIKKRFEEGDFS